MPRKYERIAVLVVLLCSPLWLSVLPSQVGTSLRISFRERLAPLYETAESLRVGLRTMALGFANAPFLFEENRFLKFQRDLLMKREEALGRLQQENARLRGLLQFKEESPHRLILAQVIGRDLGLFSRTLLINQGTQKGIRAGMAVVTPIGLVGRVSEAGPRVSRVIGITDPHFRAAALLADSRVSALAMGTASGECVLTYLPKEGELKVPQAVLTSGGNSFAPAGLAIGSIAEVTWDSSGLFRLARIKPAVPWAALEEVLVVSWTASN
jgi:rod shape-determining protein MreC